MKKIPWPLILGIFCLCFSVIPALFFWIINAGVVLLMLCGIALIAFYRLQPSLSKSVKRCFYLLLTAGFAFFGTVSAMMAWHAWANPPPPQGPDAVIVLGSKIIGNKPSRMLARRLNTAAEYLQQHPDVVCVVSGGQGADEAYTEAYVMAAYLIEVGIEPSRILLEERSTNTQQNLEYSCKLLRENGYQVEHITIVTDSFHQMRAAILARKGGVAVSAVSSHTPWGLYPCYWVREWPAIIKALVWDNGV